MDYAIERWSLDELFRAIDAPEVQGALDRIEQLTKEIEAYRPRLSADIEEATFLELLNLSEKLVRLLSRLVGYGSLRFSEDTQDQQVQAFLAKAQQLGAETDNRTMFFKLWWKALDEETAERLMAGSGDYRYWLETLRRQRPYTLSEPEEKVINLKDVNGPLALVNLYDSITNRYTFRLRVDGEVKELTRGELQIYVRDPDPALREAAYKELLGVFGVDAPILGQIYQYRTRDWHSEQIALRSYASPIAVRNLANDLPEAIVDALLEVSEANATVFQDYFRLKARWLGMERIRRYDIYAPVVKADREFPFTEAVELVLDSFAAFEPRVANLARKVFDERHLDSEVRKGKRSGAFCATISPDLTPWVLTSYQGRADDVATLAHELGHAIHSLLADHHTALTQDASLPLAETASTFGEMLLIDRLLAQDPDPDLRRDLLFRQMDDAYATIMRQAFFAIYERSAHERVQEGASVDELSEIYLENLRRQFGESLDLSDEFRHEWVAIPHIYHTPFYVYAYAFGQLLVFSLYQQYQQEGQAFNPRFLEILSAGGSQAPIRVLSRAGIDVASPAFWQGGFDLIQRSLEQLRAIPLPA